MKITFPHMGNMYIPLKGLLRYLDLDVVVPPYSNRRALNLGVKYAPEFACLPLKINLGNLIEAKHLGADTVIMAGGVGPCRFGLYGQVEKEILEQIGYNYNSLIIEPPEKHLGQFIGRLRAVIGKKNLWTLMGAIKFAFQKSCSVDKVERKVQYIRPREKETGTADKIYKHILQTLDNACNYQELEEATNLGLLKLAQIPLDESKEVIKIGLIGEIYTLLDPFVNLEIEKELGKLGVEVTRSLYLSEWVNTHLLLNYSKEVKTKPFAELAKPYLNYFVGGHGRETVGYAVGFAKEGYDGLIQLAPLTCMPEIIAHNIMTPIKKDWSIPILTIYIDEQSGKAGFLTRIEGFIDLISRQKNLKRRQA